MVKAKSKTRRGKGNDGTLETILRFEIIVVLFSLIGLYYFLSFSPIRMPAAPIASSPEMIAPLPPQVEPQVESGTVPETVVAVLPPSRPQQINEPVANTEAEAPPAESSSVSDSASVISKKTNLVDQEIQKSAEPLPDKLPAVAQAPKLNEGLAPVTAVSAPASLAAPLVAKPEPRPQAALAPSEKSTPTSPLPTRTIIAGEYVLQVDFLQNRDKLKALNFKVKTKIMRRPTPMYRVYLGTFPQQKKALETMAVVRKKGDDPFLQACSGGYNVVIGSFYLRSSVVAWENMYHASGFEPKVQRVTLEMPHTLLLLDGPAVQQDSDAVLAKLKAAGFSDPHLK